MKRLVPSPLLFRAALLVALLALISAPSASAARWFSLFADDSSGGGGSGSGSGSGSVATTSSSGSDTAVPATSSASASDSSSSSGLSLSELIRRSLQGSGSRAVVLPLHYGLFDRAEPLPDPRGHRRFLAEARMWLNGHARMQGYYYTRASFGTPPQPFALIVDTGSSTTYVPCASCEKCGKHLDAPFDPANSTTYQAISCSDPVCKATLMTSCTASAEPEAQDQCTYSRTYAEMSSTGGFLASDVVDFGPGSNLDPTRVTFGCETSETGALYSQKADGIIALGREGSGIVDQLVQSGAMEDSFTLCYGGMEDGGGSMILGASYVPPDMTFTPLDPSRITSPYYNVLVEEIRVNGQPLAISPATLEETPTVLDSGTTFNYMPEDMFNKFKEAFMSGVKGLQVVPKPDPNHGDICFSGASPDSNTLKDYFPSVTFVFTGGLVLDLAAENYLFRDSVRKPGTYCLGFFSNGLAARPQTLLGGLFTSNTMVTYDRANQRVGFLPMNCNNMFRELTEMEGPTTERPIVPQRVLNEKGEVDLRH